MERMTALVLGSVWHSNPDAERRNVAITRTAGHRNRSLSQAALRRRAGRSITADVSFRPGSLATLARYAPRGRRMQVLLALTPLMFQRGRSSTADSCTFSNLIDEYSEHYRQLASLLGAPLQRPADGEIEFLRCVSARAVHYEGAIGSEEFFFLAAMASILAPPRVVEIGTSTGFSAAILAGALHHRSPHSTSWLVDTIDLHSRYLLDQSQPIGFEIAEMVPALRSRVRVHTGQQSDSVKELAAPDELRLVFVDADHQHPWPLLDVLRIAPFIRGGGWIVLHDIELGRLGKEGTKNSGLTYGAPSGAQWLFEFWPFAKISGGNIGAVQLPRDKRHLIAIALDMLPMPFEMQASSHRRLYKALGSAVTTLLEVKAPRSAHVEQMGDHDQRR